MTRPENAQRIRALRIASGLTLEELAQRVGVSKETVRLWETGKGLRGANLGRLAKEFGVHPSELFPLPSGADPLPSIAAGDDDPYRTRVTFFREHGEQLSELEAEHLRGLKYKGDPGDLHWADELLRYRKINARIEAVDQKLELAKAAVRRTFAVRGDKVGTAPLTPERAEQVLDKHATKREDGSRPIRAKAARRAQEVAVAKRRPKR